LLLDREPAGRRGEALWGGAQQQVHHGDLGRVGHDPDPGQVAEGRRDLARMTEVLGHQRQPTPQAVQRGGGIRPEPEQSAAHAVPPLPYLGQDVRRAGQTAAGQRAEALVEGHVDGVEEVRDLGQRPAVSGG
jgi:hypothetical protein